MVRGYIIQLSPYELYADYYAIDLEINCTISTAQTVRVILELKISVAREWIPLYGYNHVNHHHYHYSNSTLLLLARPCYHEHIFVLTLALHAAGHGIEPQPQCSDHCTGGS